MGFTEAINWVSVNTIGTIAAITGSSYKVSNRLNLCTNLVHFLTNGLINGLTNGLPLLGIAPPEISWIFLSVCSLLGCPIAILLFSRYRSRLSFWV